MGKQAKAGGLAGVVAGKTAIATVGKQGKGLNYCGYSIDDLAEHACFEEVAYLLLHGSLPAADELESFRQRLGSARGLPEPLCRTLQSLPASAHPMDVMRTGCSVLGCLEPEESFEQQHRVAERLLAAFPSILLYWYRYHRDGRGIDTCTDDDSIAGQFLHLLH
ncbi:MAG: citrate/2-methylcitrate synthase, partial [Phycisphaeraceae bacterium]